MHSITGKGLRHQSRHDHNTRANNNGRDFVRRPARHDPLGDVRQRFERFFPGVLDVLVGVRDVRRHPILGGEFVEPPALRLHDKRGTGGTGGDVHGSKLCPAFLGEVAGRIHKR